MRSSQKLERLLFGAALSLPLGVFLASAYVNFQHGFTLQAVQSFDVFAIWYETPFYRGYVTQAFCRGLTIVGFTAVIASSCWPP